MEHEILGSPTGTQQGAVTIASATPTPLPKLLDQMASPDPDVRDGSAYQELYTRIRVTADLSNVELTYIAERAVAHLTHPAVQARTFAPLILTWLVRAQNHCPTEWFNAATDWYLNEPDTRGHDTQ